MTNSNVKLKGSSNLHTIYLHCKKELPIEALRLIKDWDIIQKSPYSLSLYNKPKDWNNALPDTIRIADHWNFESKGRMHCETQGEVPNNTHWCIAIFDDNIEKFIPIMIIEKRPKTKMERIEAELIFIEICFNRALTKSRGDFNQINKEVEGRIEMSYLKKKYELLEQL